MTTERYPKEILGEDDDCGVMPDNVAELEKAVVGHKIVSAERVDADPTNRWDHAKMILTLDTGRRVTLTGSDDCCAYTDIEGFLLHPERVDHVITGVGTTEEYQRWHIYADMGDILELEVGWSPGNPFYYGYGFYIDVSPAEPQEGC